jgi:hypothetical protein
MESLRYRTLLTVVLLSLGLATGAGADVFLMDFAGYDFAAFGPTITSPPANLGEPGSCYWAEGFVNSVNPTYLTVDYTNDENTFVLQHMCYVSSDTVGTNVFHYYTGGSFDVFADPIATGTAAYYAPFPPNASHVTFEDGENLLGGDFTADIVIWVDLATGNGSIGGNLVFSRGTQLGSIPVDQRSMSLFIAGMLYLPPAGPEGYIWQLDGQVFIPDAVAVQKTTWGQIKQLGGR